jgi:hypothetical protein
VALLQLTLSLLRKNNMKDVFLGAITDEVVQYDGSGVVQPQSSKRPDDVSVTDPNTGDVITPDNKDDDEDMPETSNNWIMYLGVGIMAYDNYYLRKNNHGKILSNSLRGLPPRYSNWISRLRRIQKGAL